MDVTVILVTYEHGPFIAQAVESVMAQRTRAAWELLISDDGSADATREIIARAAGEHPDRVRLLLSERNLNSNEVTLRALRVARGRYLAFLDGDDYWTSPEKLQRQVEFLDRHPECAMCFHNVVVFREDAAAAPREFNASTLPAITGLPAILDGNYVAGCSPMIRRDALTGIPAWYEHAPFGDWPLYIFAAQRGAIGFLPEVMGAYRLHDRGLWSGATRVRQLEGLVRFYRSVSDHLGPPYRSHVARLLAARMFELGLETDRAGRRADAMRYVMSSFRLRPFTRAIRPGRRVWHLARMASAALAARLSTVDRDSRLTTRE